MATKNMQLARAEEEICPNVSVPFPPRPNLHMLCGKIMRLCRAVSVVLSVAVPACYDDNDYASKEIKFKFKFQKTNACSLRKNIRNP